MIGGDRARPRLDRLRSETAGAVAIGAAIIFTALSEGGYGVAFSAVAGLLVWWAILCAVVLGRCTANGISARSYLALGLLAAYSLWALASMLWATDAGLALREAVKHLTYLGVFCAAVLLAPRTPVRMWIHGIAGGLAAIAVIALAVRFFPGLEGDRETLQAALPSAQGRLGFPVGYWNALAACMAMAMVLLAPLSVFARHRLARAAWAALIPLPVLVIFLASSRGGAAAAVAGALVLLLLAPGRMALAVTFAIAAPASLLLTALAADQNALLQGLAGIEAGDEGIALFLVSLVALAGTFASRLLLDEPVGSVSLPPAGRRVLPFAVGLIVVAGIAAADPVERWQEFKDPPDFEGSASTFVARHLQSGNGNGRYQFWGTALDAMGDKPLHGLGAGGFETYWNRNGPIEYRLRDAHSLLFESASELGLVGLACILGFFGVVGWVGLRRSLASHRQAEALPSPAILVALLATGLAAVLVDWTWEIPAVALPMLLAAALLTTGGDAGPGSPPGASGRLKIALIGAGLVCAVALANVVLTESQLRSSREAAARGDLTEAAESAERAAALAPWSAAPPAQSALIAERLGDVESAREQIAEAIEHSPDDWKLRVIAARFALEANDARSAKELLDAARRLNPRSAILLRRPVPPGILPRNAGNPGPP